MEEIYRNDWEISPGPPATLGEVYDSSLDSQRKVQNVNSYTRGLMEAYDRVNDEVKKSVGAELINPFNRFRGPSGDAMGAPGGSVYDAEPWMKAHDDPVKAWEKDLDDLAGKHPDAFDWATLKSRPIAEVAKLMKASEDKQSDVSQRRGFIDPKEIPGIGRVPLVRDVVGGAANIIKDPAGMAASFAGSLRGSLESPADLLANVVGGVAGSASKSLVKNAIRNGLANAGVQAVLEPVVQGNRAAGGLEYGWDKAFEDIAGAFGTGAALDLAVRPAGRAAIKRFGTDTPEGTFSRNVERGGIIFDAPEQLPLPPLRARTPELSPELIERARNDDVAALREIAEKTGIIDQPAVKGALDYAELGGKIDEAAIQRFKAMGVDTGEGMRILGEAMRDPDRYLRMPEPIRQADAPLMREEAQALLTAQTEKVAALVDGLGPQLGQVVARALEAGLPQIVPLVREALGSGTAALAKLTAQIGDGAALADAVTIHTSNNLLDVVDAMRRSPDAMDSNVPISTDFMTGARALAALDPDAYALVRGGEVAPAIAAEVANLVPLEQQARMLADLRKAGVQTAAQARQMIADILPNARAADEMPLSGGSRIDDPAGPEAKAQTDRLREEHSDALKEAKAPIKERDKVEDEVETIRGEIAKLEEKISKTEAEKATPEVFAELSGKRDALRAAETRLAELNNDLIPGDYSPMFAFLAERIEMQRARDVSIAVNDALRLADTILPERARVTVTAERLDVDGVALDAMERAGDITLALHALDPAARLGHEGVHALVSRGHLSPQEVELLAQAGRATKAFSPENEARYRDAYADRPNLERQIAEEAAAHFVEAKIKAPAPDVQTIADRVRALIQRVKNALDGYGFKTADDVRSAILRGDVAKRQAQQQWMRTNPEVVPGVTPLARGTSEPPVSGFPTLRNTTMYAIKAFHGSPHDFDRFSLDKIGTGEGAQSYGHGLYFAENEAVAKTYKAPTAHVRAGAIYQVFPTEAEALAAAGPGGGAMTYRDGWVAERADGGVIRKTPGTLYEVRINAEPEQFLDWDKPLDQQGSAVRSILASVTHEGAEKWQDFGDGAYALHTNGGIAGGIIKTSNGFRVQATGGTPRRVFATLEEAKSHVESRLSAQQMLGDVLRQPAYTDKLRAAGLPGIRYLDQGSRGEGQGTYNFVVFDDKLIEITAKDGVPMSAKDKSDVMFALRDGGRQDPLGYTSRALDAARGLKQAKGTPEQMLAQLKAAGVRQAELDATGLGDFLKNKIASDHSGVVAFKGFPKHKIGLSGAREITGSYFAAERGVAEMYGDVKEYRIKATDAELLEWEDRLPDNLRELGQEFGLNETAPTVTLYRQMSLRLPGGSTEANDVLKSRGYKGIKYWDYDSRGSNDGDRAYALFDRDTATEFSGTKSHTITRDAIVQHLEANRVEIKEVTYGEPAIRARAAKYYPETPFDELSLAQRDAMSDRSTLPKWSAHSLDPSNPTYRETVLHLPGKEFAETPEMKAAVSRRMELDEIARERRWTEAERDEARRLPSIIRDIEEGRHRDNVNFKSGHFPEPNIVGHLMTSTVKDAQGRPVYLIDQIQSDWGQRLRDNGVRDEAKITDLQARIAPLRAEYQKLVAAIKAGPVVAARIVRDENPELISKLHMLQAELGTAEASAPGHTLVNTTDQWTNTTLRRAIRQAAEQDAHAIAIPSGDTVLTYNPGDTEGMRGFYDKIVPKNLRNLLQKIDKASPSPERVDTLDTPTKGKQGAGFTVFPLTDAVKRTVLDEGQPMFALRSSGLDPSPEARKARAEEMGFDTSKVWYHGSPDFRDVRSANAFSRRQINAYNIATGTFEKLPQAIYLSPDRHIAGSYADDRRAFDYQNAEPEVFSSYIRLGKTLELNAGGVKFSELPIVMVKMQIPKEMHANFDTLVTQYIGERSRGTIKTGDIEVIAQKLGFDSFVIRNVKDTYNATGKPGTIAAVFSPEQIRSVNAMFDPDKAGSANLMFALADPEPPKPPLHTEVAMLDRLSKLKDLAMHCKG